MSDEDQCTHARAHARTLPVPGQWSGAARRSLCWCQPGTLPALAHTVSGPATIEPHQTLETVHSRSTGGVELQCGLVQLEEDEQGTSPSSNTDLQGTCHRPPWSVTYPASPTQFWDPNFWGTSNHTSTKQASLLTEPSSQA